MHTRTSAQVVAVEVDELAFGVGAKQRRAALTRRQTQRASCTASARDCHSNCQSDRTSDGWRRIRDGVRALRRRLLANNHLEHKVGPHTTRERARHFLRRAHEACRQNCCPTAQQRKLGTSHGAGEEFRVAAKGPIEDSDGGLRAAKILASEGHRLVAVSRRLNKHE